MASHEMHRFEDLQHKMERPMELVKDYPMSTLMVAFTAGLGVGILIAQACIPDFEEPSMSDRLSRQIHDAVAKVIPRGMTRQLPF